MILNEDKQASFISKDYVSLYNRASNKEQFLDNFLKEFVNAFSLRLTPDLVNYLKQLANSMGATFYSYKDNIYLQFIVTYSQVCNISKLLGTDLELIVNLYGEAIISRDNIHNSEDIIYVEDLYNLAYDEAKYLCQVSYWLKNQSNARQLCGKLNKLTEPQFNQFYALLNGTNRVLAQPKPKFAVNMIGNYILFKNGEYQHKGQGILHSSNAIERAIGYVDNLSVEDPKTLLDNLRKMELSDVDKATLEEMSRRIVTDKTKAVKAIKYFMDKYKLNL